VFATRDGDTPAIDTAGFRELRLGSLGREAAEALLSDRGGAELKDDVRARILEMAQGNPLALLELPLSPGGEQLLGPFGTPIPLTPALEDAFLARARGLSPASQRLLLLAAADDTGDRACVLGAAAQLGIGAAEVEAAEATGLLRVTTDRVNFRHPLVRSAVYASAPFSERAAVPPARPTPTAGPGTRPPPWPDQTTPWPTRSRTARSVPEPAAVSQRRPPPSGGPAH